MANVARSTPNAAYHERVHRDPAHRWARDRIAAALAPAFAPSARPGRGVR